VTNLLPNSGSSTNSAPVNATSFYVHGIHVNAAEAGMMQVAKAYGDSITITFDVPSNHAPGEMF
jgi:hypothetical protein